MNLLTRFAAVAFGLAPATFALPSDFYVDPLNGSNSLGSGTQQSPYQTISFVAGSIAASSDTIVLLPGTYSSATGESFPIDLTFQSIEVRGEGPCLPHIVGPAGSPYSPVFRNRSDSATFRDLRITTGGQGIRSQAFAANLDMDNVDMDARVGVIFEVRGAGIKYVDIDDCSLDCTDTAISFKSNRNQTIQARMRGNLLTGGPYGNGLRSTTTHVSATVDVEQWHSVIHGSRNGMLSQPGVGSITIQSTSCTFTNNGIFTVPASGGSIVDTGFVTQGLSNCLFSADKQNRNMPNFDSNNYTVRTAIVQQTSPAVVQGTGSMPITKVTVANAPLVDPAGGDFHLLPGNPAIDAGTTDDANNPISDTDLDGDERYENCVADSAPDIGADEYVSNYVYVLNETVQPGDLVTLRYLGSPAEDYFVWGHLPGASHSLCDALPSPTQFYGQFVTDSNGIGTTTFLPQGNPPTGTEVVLSTATLFSASPNVARALICD